MVSFAPASFAIVPAHLTRLNQTTSSAPSAKATDDLTQAADQEVQKLQEENQVLMEQQQALQAKIQAYQALGNQQAGTINDLQSTNQSLSEALTQLDQTLQTLSASLTQAQSALGRHRLPSFTRAVLSQSHQTMNCAQGSNCHFSRQIPLTDEDKLHAADVSSAMQSRYFMPVTVSVIVLIILILVFALLMSMRERARLEKQKNKLRLTGEDKDAVSGEDLSDSRLDMARALIEMGEFEAAKEALKDVLEHGNDTQCQQAKKLLAGMK